jgi:hypothetical protein
MLNNRPRGWLAGVLISGIAAVAQAAVRRNMLVIYRNEIGM